jgi:hypothetical protein
MKSFLAYALVQPLRDTRRSALRVKEDTPRDLGCQ